MRNNIKVSKGNGNKKNFNNTSKKNTLTSKDVMNQLPAECFVLSGQENVYHGAQSLPYVGLQYRNVLDFMGIPYEKTRMYGVPVYRYWDPNCVEYEEKSLPLYFRGSNDTYKTATKVKASIPTAWMWNAAKNMQENVEKTLKYYKRYAFAKNVLNGKSSGVALTEKIIHDQDIEWKDDKIRVFSYQVDKTRSIMVFFDLNKIEGMRANLPDPVVKDAKGKTKTLKGQLHLIMDVPTNLESYIGYIVGKDYARSEFMAKSLNVKSIFIRTQTNAPWYFKK